MTAVYLGFGSNLGDRVKNISRAYRLINKPNIGQIITSSGFYQSAPIDFVSIHPFINSVAKIITALKPRNLLFALKSIEKEIGRQVSLTPNDRLIDIDILFYGQQIIKESELILPHPRLIHRKFVLNPLLEIAPDLMHPETNRTVLQIWKRAAPSVKKQEVKKIDKILA